MILSRMARWLSDLNCFTTVLQEAFQETLCSVPNNFCVEFACLLSLYVGFLQVLWFLSTVQRHVVKLIVFLSVPCVCVCVCLQTGDLYRCLVYSLSLCPTMTVYKS